MLKKVAEFKEKFYPRKWAKYEEATKSQIKLVLENYQLEELKKEYEQMREMIMGERPRFEDIMETIGSLEAEIHKL